LIRSLDFAAREIRGRTRSRFSRIPLPAFALGASADSRARNPPEFATRSLRAGYCDPSFDALDGVDHEIWLASDRAHGHPAGMNLLSIQSHVAYGHVGNSAAVFALQRLGVEVWPIHTVELSNHPGYDGFRGRVAEAAAIRELVQGIAERGLLGRCDGVISGYLGTADIGEQMLAAVADVKAANPAARYCCDPVIGDTGRGVYVRPEVADFVRARAVAAADVVTPNQFELEWLSGRASGTLGEAIAGLDTLHAIGPRVILVTSLSTAETPPDAIDLIVSEPAGRFRLRTPKLPLAVNGAGDAIAALFFAHLLRTGSAAAALSRATSSVFGILRRTARTGAREMLLIEAQDEIVAPSEIFQPEPM
jgi:pyridoxine kinase